MIFTKERLSNICIDLCMNSFAYKAEIFPLWCADVPVLHFKK